MTMEPGESEIFHRSKKLKINKIPIENIVL